MCYLTCKQGRLAFASESHGPAQHLPKMHSSTQKPVDRPSLPKLTNLLRTQPSGRSYLQPHVRELAGPECAGTRLQPLEAQMAQISAYLRVGTQAGQRGLLEGWRAQCSDKAGQSVVGVGTQVARKPPSTGNVEPEVIPLLLLSRKRMASTTFSTSAGRGGPGDSWRRLPSPFSPSRAPGPGRHQAPVWTPA